MNLGHLIADIGVDWTTKGLILTLGHIGTPLPLKIRNLKIVFVYARMEQNIDSESNFQEPR